MDNTIELPLCSYSSKACLDTMCHILWGETIIKRTELYF